MTDRSPNGSRLSCGASAGGRKRPALRDEFVGAQTYASLKAGPASFKRLLGSHFSEIRYRPRPCDAPDAA